MLCGIFSLIRKGVTPLKNKKIKSGISILLWPVLFVLLLILVNIICGGRVLNAYNLNSVIIHAANTIFVAWAFCFVFAADYMDLSIFSVVVLASYGGGELGNRFGMMGVLIGAVLVAVLCMFINFLVHAKSGIPSWIGGLGMCMIYEAIAAAYSSAMIKMGTRVVQLKAACRGFASAPYTYILLLAGFLFVYLVYNKTTTGLNVRAIGNEPAVAKAMGINFTKTIMLTGIACGVLVGFAATMNISVASQVSAQTGLTSLGSMFQPLASVMFAQIISQIDKRINIVVAVPFCTFLIYMIFNALTMLGIPSGTLQNVALGTIILGFGIVANIKTKGIVK